MGGDQTPPLLLGPFPSDRRSKMCVYGDREKSPRTEARRAAAETLAKPDIIASGALLEDDEDKGEGGRPLRFSCAAAELAFRCKK